MINSTKIEDLRPDVAANCRIFLELCKQETGFPLGISSTVRDDEWQRYAVSQGWAPKTATVPTFHSIKAGLAFDIFRNVKGREWDNSDKFFDKCGAIALKMGFVWPISKSDLGHIQWGGPKRNWTNAQILRGEYPPEMPLYKIESEEEEMRYNTLSEIPNYAKSFVKSLCDKKILVGGGIVDADGYPADMNLTDDMIRTLMLTEKRLAKITDDLK